MQEEINIGERINELMIERDIDTKTLAKDIEVTISTVSRWRNNDKHMRLSQIVKIANYLDCSLDFLTGRSDEVLDFQPQECPPFYDWKNGADPHILSLIELADYLDVTLDRLVGREK